MVAVLQDRIHQMGSCLLQMDGSEDPSVHVTLQSLTTEAMTLVAQLVRTHGKVSGPIVHNGRAPSALDDPLHGQPDEAFYCRVLVSLCSTLGLTTSHKLDYHGIERHVVHGDWPCYGHEKPTSMLECCLNDNAICQLQALKSGLHVAASHSYPHHVDSCTRPRSITH